MMTDVDSDSNESSTTTSYYDGRWKDASCFEDLVEKTRMFLCGHVYDTPVHLAPLNDESSVILQQLKKLTDHGVMTTCSQPAYDSPIWRQRGYVEGYWRGAIDDFATRITTHTDLEFFVTDGNRIISDLTAPNGTWAWTQSRQNDDSEWLTCTGMMFGSLIDKTEDQPYDTPYYELSTDTALVKFMVCDAVFGDPPTTCCDFLVVAMS